MIPLDRFNRPTELSAPLRWFAKEADEVIVAPDRPPTEAEILARLAACTRDRCEDCGCEEFCVDYLRARLSEFADTPDAPEPLDHAAFMDRYHAACDRLGIPRPDSGDYFASAYRICHTPVWPATTVPVTRKARR